jgi:hypothetical protein
MFNKMPTSRGLKRDVGTADGALARTSEAWAKAAGEEPRTGGAGLSAGTDVFGMVTAEKNV